MFKSKNLRFRPLRSTSSQTKLTISSILIVLGSSLALDYGFSRIFPIYVLALVALVVLLVCQFLRSDSFPLSLLLLSLCALWLGISSLWSINLAAIQEVPPYILGVLLAWSAYFSFKKESSFLTLTYFLVCIAVTAEVLSFFDITGGRLYLGRILPNQLSTLLSIGLVSSFYIFINNRRMIYKVSFGLLTLFLSYGLLMTGSRGGVAGLMLALVLLIILMHKQAYDWAKVHRVTLIIGTLFIAIMICLGLTKQFQRVTNYNIHDRYSYAKIAFDLFKANPIIGNGIGGFKVEGITLQTDVIIQTTNAHASLLQLLAETGLIGVGLLMAAFVVVYREIRSSFTKWTKLYGFMLLVYCLQASVDIHLSYTSMIYLFFVLFGVTVASTQLKHSNK